MKLSLLNENDDPYDELPEEDEFEDEYDEEDEDEFEEEEYLFQIGEYSIKAVDYRDKSFVSLDYIIFPPNVENGLGFGELDLNDLRSLYNLLLRCLSEQLSSSVESIPNPDLNNNNELINAIIKILGYLYNGRPNMWKLLSR